MEQQTQEWLNKHLLRAFLDANLKEVKILISLGADIKSIDVNRKVISRKREIPLISIACECGELELVKLLRDNGTEINVYDSEGLMPLHHATMGIGGECYHDIVEFLVEEGADLNAVIKETIDHDMTKLKTPLLRVSYFANSKTVKYLLEHGADVRFGNPLALCRERLKTKKETGDPSHEIPDFEETIEILESYIKEDKTK